jgi:hypothetical protein
VIFLTPFSQLEMSNWREILRAQEEDLKRMEEMDAALNEDQEDLDLNIKAILRVGNHRSAVGGKGTSQKISGVSELDNSSERMKSSQHREVMRPTSRNDENVARRGGESRHLQLQLQHEVEDSRGGDDEDDGDENLLNSKSEKSILSPSMKQQAPDTTARSSDLLSHFLISSTADFCRIQKARLKSLTKQLEESKELRKQLMEQINDMQRQLKSERDDNKQLRKR